MRSTFGVEESHSGMAEHSWRYGATQNGMWKVVNPNRKSNVISCHAMLMPASFVNTLTPSTVAHDLDEVWNV